jgi:hypothetical protein
MHKTRFAAKSIIAYELMRFLLLIFSHSVLPVTLLPATWYVAVPLLVLPPVLAVLLAFDDSPGAYRNIYILVKIMSAVGTEHFVVSAFLQLRRNGLFVTDYLIKQMGIMQIFFLIDVILVIYVVFKKGGGTECR